MNLSDPIDKATFYYSRTITEIFSKSFSVSTRFLPKEKRWATYALYGFCRYVDNLIDQPRNRTPKELCEEAEALKGELKIAYRTGESEHPVVRAFIKSALKFNIPPEYPLDLIKGVQMDLLGERYKTFEELYLFCYRVAGTVGIMMTHILGFNSGEAFHYAEKLGVAMQLTNILRDIKEDKNLGRIYIPKHELEDFGLCDNDIINENFNDQFKLMMQFQVNRAQKFYYESGAGIRLLHRKSQFAIYTASKIYSGILVKIIENGYNPFLGRVFLSKTKKLTILIKELFVTRIFFKKNVRVSVGTNVNFANENVN